MKKTITHSEYQIEIDNIIPSGLINEHPKFKRFINIARDAAVESSFDKYRLGAVVVLRGKVIARGFNLSKSHPKQKILNTKRKDFELMHNHFVHAEMSVLNKLKKTDLSKAQIFVYHVGPKGEHKMARPCAACMSAIKSAGIKTIHYSTPDGFATEYISIYKEIKVKRSNGII